MTKRDRLVWVVIFVSGIAWTSTAAINSNDVGLPYNVWLDLAVSWSYIGGGLIALARRPRNAIGLIMAAVGFLWMSHGFAPADDGSPWHTTFAEAFNGSSIPVTMHLVFAYPGGRLHRRSERTLILAGYTALLVFQSLFVLFVFDPDQGLRTAAPFPNELLTVATLLFGALGPMIFSLIAIGLLVRRFVIASALERRSYPELWIAAAAASSLVIGTAIQLRFVPSDSFLINDVLSVVKILIPLSLVVGLFRIQLSRAAVGGLVVELGSSDRRVREALARALGDPAVEVAYWLPEREVFVDEDGNGVELPQAGSSRAVTLVEREGTRLAAVIHDPALVERGGLIEAATAALALALHNARLQAELRAQLLEVQASRTRIVEAADAERARIERNLHDGAQQRLLSLAFALREVERKLDAGQSSEARERVRSSLKELDAAMTELRELARGIHPAILDEEGLGPALVSLAERAAVPVEVKTQLPVRLPTAVEVTAYFVAAEALTNVARYADASTATIEAVAADGALRLRVCDDGKGGADAQLGSGLRGLSDRIAALGGTFEVDSHAGAGTTVGAWIPCGPASPDATSP